MAGTKGSKNRKSAAERDKQAKKSIWPITYRLVAVGTLVAYTAIGSQKIALGKAQEERGGSGSQSRQPVPPAALPTRRFEIAPGALADVLGAFEKTSGLQVLVPNEQVRNVSSPGVTGVYTDEQALHHILEGTGVSFRFISTETVRLDITPLSQSVTVTESEDGLSLSKYTQPILDTPQTINTVSQQVMQEQRHHNSPRCPAQCGGHQPGRRRRRFSGRRSNHSRLHCAQRYFPRWHA